MVQGFDAVTPRLSVLYPPKFTNYFHTFSPSQSPSSNSKLTKNNKFLLEHALLKDLNDIFEQNGYNKDSQIKVEEHVYKFLSNMALDNHNITKFFGGFDSSLLSNRDFIILIRRCFAAVKNIMKL